MTDAICLELEGRQGYLNGEEIKTIYFGGGTPSILPLKDLKLIVDSVYKYYAIDENVEFTFECNPDDLTDQKLTELKQVGVNRLSIGIQSFDDIQLTFMNRAHNANEANNCVKLAQIHGFNNITIDLIYGLPNTDTDYWTSQINKALSLNIDHISAYCLTIEDKTVFGSWQKKGKLNPLSDEKSLSQFKLLQNKLNEVGFEHYEISNFAKNGRISKHNSAYWLGESYIAIGPSAHSYDGQSRQWNIANNIEYIKAIQNSTPYFEKEILSSQDKFNEYILTRLRTKWGVSLSELFKTYPTQQKQVQIKIDKFINNGDLELTKGSIFLTKQGKFIADYISSELFV